MEKARKQLKSNAGITLVALVVTIIVLVILASISIGAVFSEKGIIQQAKDAKKTHEDAVKKEEENLNDLLGEYNNSMSGSGSSGGGAPTPTPVPTPTPTPELPDITPTTPAGTEVKKPGTWDSKKVTAIADGKGGLVPLPNEYYYVGGDYNTGLVISDKAGDTMDASGTGMRKPVCVDTCSR